MRQPPAQVPHLSELVALGRGGNLGEGLRRGRRGSLARVSHTAEPVMLARTRDDVAALIGAISQRIGEPRYRLWFDKNARFRVEGHTLVVGVPNRHFQEWLEKTFGADVAAAACEVYGEELEVRFRIEPQLFQAARREQAEGIAPAPEAVEEAPQPRLAPKARSRRWHKLSDFVVGPCNRVAHAAAVSVAEAPGDCVNPLVIHGPVGTGKTHLLEGIYASVRKMHPE